MAGLLSDERAGVIDFGGAVFKEMSLSQMSFRLSDHFPLWVEFITTAALKKWQKI